MRILLIGKNGQVGSQLARRLPALGAMVALGRDDLDLADTAHVRRAIHQIAPDLIVNAAAYTAVDQAEAEPETARRVNSDAPWAMAEAAEDVNAGLVHFSTDYVFDGKNREPYVESDPVNPLSVYGRTKLDGEQAVLATGAQALILRLSWVYDLARHNFVSRVLRWAEHGDPIRVVADQVSVPTWSVRVAETTVELLRRLAGEPDFPAALRGLYHLTPSGEASRYDWAREILRLAGIDRKVLRAKAAEFPTPAARPSYSVMSNNALSEAFELSIPDWREDLTAAFAERVPV